MPLFIPNRRVRPKRFDYEPRFYNPEHDEKLKRRMHIRSKTRRGNPPRLVWIAILLFFALYLYVKLG